MSVPYQMSGKGPVTVCRLPVNSNKDLLTLRALNDWYGKRRLLSGCYPQTVISEQLLNTCFTNIFDTCDIVKCMCTFLQ